jgi:hypothetical protein
MSIKVDKRQKQILLVLIIVITIIFVSTFKYCRANSVNLPYFKQVAPSETVNAPIQRKFEQNRQGNTSLSRLVESVQQRPSSNLPFGLVGKDRILTEQALNYADIPNSKAKQLQKHFDQLIDRTINIMRTKVSVDEIRSDPVKGISAFRIEPFPEEGQQLLNSFRDALKDEVGEMKASKLNESFAWWDIFGGFGSTEVIATLHEFRDKEGQSFIKASWESRDPESGAVLRKSSGPYSAWVDKFGDLLEIKDE